MTEKTIFQPLPYCQPSATDIPIINAYILHVVVERKKGISSKKVKMPLNQV